MSSRRQSLFSRLTALGEPSFLLAGSDGIAARKVPIPFRAARLVTSIRPGHPRRAVLSYILMCAGALDYLSLPECARWRAPTALMCCALFY